MAGFTGRIYDLGPLLRGSLGGQQPPQAVSTLPVDGSDLDRYTPITFRLRGVPGDEAAFIYFYYEGIGQPVVVHDVNGFTPLFDDHSTKTADGADLVFSILPRGGWEAAITALYRGAFEDAIAG